MPVTILTVNTGSASVRLAAFPDHEMKAAPIVRTRRIGHDQPPTALLASFLRSHDLGSVAGVAHRVVHGGPARRAPCCIDAAVERDITQAALLAPMHNPTALAWVQACREVLGPTVPQVAVFDTGFFADLPESAGYALPPDLCRRHNIRRYGFHGIAHEVLWRRWRALRPELADGGRLVSFQLGAGCSATAIDRGRPMDTSMGFSPAEGLVMATRAGDVDPGVLTLLVRTEGLRAQQLDRLLTRESGLLGVSGLSGDVQVLLASREPAARRALDLFCHRARRYLGAFLAVLGGADGVVLGGGIGEHAVPVRARILAGLEWCGLTLDEGANAAAVGREGRISREGSRMEAWVIPVDEGALLAEKARALLALDAT